MDQTQIEDSNIGQQTQIEESDIDQQTHIQESDIGQHTQIQESDIDQQTIQDSDIHQQTQIEDSNIGQQTQIEESDIDQQTQIQESDIGQHTQIQESDIGQHTQIEDSNIGQQTQIEESDIDQQTQIQESDIGQHTQIQESDIGQHTQIQESDIDQQTIQDSDIHQQMQIEDSDTDQQTQIEESDIDQQTQIQDSDIDQQTQIQESDIDQQTQIQESDIHQQTQIEDSDMPMDQQTQIGESDIDQQTQIQESDIDQHTQIEDGDIDHLYESAKRTEIPETIGAPETSAPITIEDIKIEEKEDDQEKRSKDIQITIEDIKTEEKEADQEKKSNIKSDEDAGDEKVKSVFMGSLPWLIAAGFGFILLIIAVVLLASAQFSPFMLPYKPHHFNVPDYQGSMRVYSVDGQKLKYVNDLRFIASQVSRSLRYKVEPKLKQIYSKASLDVDSVVVLSFKYGGAGESSVTQDGRSIIGRSADSEKESGILVRHWVYLAQNTTDTVESLKAKVIATIDEADGIKIDRSSVSFISLENMTRVDAMKALAQAGFFKNGLAGLDLGLLDIFGLSSLIALQTEDDEEGLCRSLRVPRHGYVSPSICTTSIHTFVQMVCEFSCDAEYKLVGSRKRVCLSSGLWSGETAQCHKTCSPLKMVSVEKIQPLTCSSQYISAGQMCFLECPSTHRMTFPPNLSFLRKLPERDVWPSLGYKTEKSDEVEPYSDVNGYFRECGSEGRWIGSDASCKASCPKLHPPLHGSVQPFDCRDHPVEGQRCTVSCDNGYGIIEGTQILTCDVTGKWTDEVAVCQKLCPLYSGDGHLIVTPRICRTFPHEGIECEHECQITGYKMTGARKRICAGGSWDNILPTCVETCGPADKIKNGMFVHDGGPCYMEPAYERTKCWLLCDPGHLPSRTASICSRGVWNFVGASYCSRPCTPLDSVEFGSWSLSSCNATLPAHTHLHGFCELTCNVGYTLYGSSSVACSKDGDWTDQPGKCIMNCPALPNSIHDGPTYCFDGNATVGQICEFTCNAGSRIIGDRILTCMADGNWSTSLPSCQAEDQYYILQTSKSHTICLIADADGNANKLVNQNGSCDTENGRWVLDGGRLQNVYTRTCLTASQSSNLMHMQECDSGNSDQGIVCGFGSTLKIFGIEKYITSGYRTIENLQLTSFVSSFIDENLLWMFHNATSGLSSVGSNLFSLRNDGHCKALTLSYDMAVEPNACASTFQPPNASCVLNCTSGGLSDPSKNITVCHNGVWNGDPDIFCIPQAPKKCGSYKQEWNILVEPSDCQNGDTNPGGTCTIKCANSTEEYLDGPSLIECLESGRWSPRRKPACKRRCKSLFADFKDSYLYCSEANGLSKPGSICVLTCKSGFELTGASMLTCTDNGEWSSPLPECTAICHDFGNISHVYLTNCSLPKSPSGYLAGSTCDIACESKFHPGISVPSITCQSDGAWVSHVHGDIDCLRSCPVFAVTSSISMQPEVSPDCLNGTRLNIGHKCTFHCRDGYRLTFGNPADDDGSVNHTRTCMDDGTWSGSVVACTTRCRSFPEISDGGFYSPPTCQTSSSESRTICSLLCHGNKAVYGGPSVLTCGEDGHWKPNAAFGKCSPACGALPKSPYITITPGSCAKRYVKKGTDCILTCPDHMERIGPGYRKCVGVPDFESGSLWSGNARPTTCLGRCLPLTINIGSRVFPKDCTYRSKLEGDICSFECSAGYSMLGNAALQCKSSGTWNDVAPSCYRPCPPITVSNGQVSCNEAYGFLSEGFGYVYRPGTKCYYSCSSGFAAYKQNEIFCDEDGVWIPSPYCSPVSDPFPIIQKIGDESVCLQVSQSIESSEWHLTTTTNSTQGCQAAGNNAMWIWFYSLNLKHAETGLCLTAESALADAAILLRRCDISNKLQHWTCDPQHSYRFVLKDTDLSIDTVYKALGPVLQSWTHAQTYWITFNSVLEAVGTVCSNKLVGACPGIIKPSMKVVPAVCSTDEVTIWQKCALSCEEGALFDGSTSVVECQPTGEWKDFDQIFCRKNCPALPVVENGYYDVLSCIQEESIHQALCNLTCSASYVLPNNHEFSVFACNDGKWIGEFGLTCQDRCKNPPVAPNNSRIDCISKTCQIVCNMGYTIRGGSSLFNCTDGYDYVTANNITCDEEFHFRIQLRTAVFTPFPTICMSAIIERGKPRVGKVPCYAGDSFHYWRWEDSHDVVGRNFSMLRNAGTGLCLSATSVENWAELVLNNCNETDDLQQWTCHNYLHPGRFGLVSSTRYYVDAGSIVPYAPPILREENVGTGSSDWIAVDLYGNLRYTCGSRKIGACPKLFFGPYTTVDLQGCASWDGLPVATECRTSCQDADYQLPGGVLEHTTICLDSGTWNKHPQLCTAKRSDNNDTTCASFNLTRWLIVTPEKCGEIIGQDILFGESCEFTCQSGYYLEGSEQILCNGSDQWTDVLPKCIRYCPGIPPKQGVELSNERCRSIVVPDGTTCNMTCAEGFLPSTALPSSVETECQIDGTWTVSEMLCEATCQALSEPPFYATSDADDLQDPTLFRRLLTSLSCANSSSLPRTICAFSCGSGNVTVEGSDELTCNLNGMWNGRAPRCVEKYYCPKLMNTNLTASYAALLDDIAVSPGTVVKIKCDDGYIPDGDDVRMCQMDGMWGGNGPVIPTCTKKCSPLVPPFATEIAPTLCFTGYVEDGVNCTFYCADGTEIEAGATVTVCNKGEWSNPIPKCLVKDPSNIDNLNVLTYPDGFLIITREPETGCLYAAVDNVVRWRPAHQCDPGQLVNRWKWYDSQRIVNARGAGDQCMQPLDSTQSDSTLIVGPCNSTVKFVCGNPRSVFYKYSLFTSSSPRWRIGFITDPVKGTPESIFMVKAELGFTDLPNDVFEGITVYGNVDIMNPSNTDSTICSYACRASISFANVYHSKVITSPGLIFNQKYPANTHCEWDFFGFGKIITLELLEIDMEPNEKRDCLRDCLTVHASDSEGSVFSEHLATYSGNDIFEQRPRVIMSVSSSLHVTFRANSATQGGGFAMTYKFEDVPDPRTQCGVRTKYDKELEDSGTTGKNPGLQGDFTDIKKWPWLVSIREKYRGSSKAYHRCTGALIANNVVVTAAHCARFTREWTLSSVDIGVGLALQNDMDEAARNKTSASEPIFQIYHGYDSISRNGDIALWKLSEPVTLSDSIFPICLPLEGYRIHQPKATCFSAGWNSLTRGHVLNQIMEYEVTMASSSWCMQTLGLSSETTFACAENINFDTSGLNEKTESDPLMCEFNGNWYLAGVRSYTHIGTRRVFRLYTEVSGLANWIAHTVETMNMYSTSQGGHLLI